MAMKLHAKTREAKGRQVRALRREGRLPGVMYGHGAETVSVDFDPSEFRRVYRDAGTSALIDVSVNDAAPVKALIQDVQVHLLHMHPVHVDLRQIRMDEELEVSVPLHFVGVSAAVKDLSGTLVRTVKEITVTCLPADLPSELEVDLTKLATFDDVIHVSDINIPKGATIDLDPEAVVASVSAPLTEEQLKKMEEEANVDVSTVEVEGEKKEEGEGSDEGADSGEKEDAASES